MSKNINYKPENKCQNCKCAKGKHFGPGVKGEEGNFPRADRSKCQEPSCGCGEYSDPKNKLKG